MRRFPGAKFSLGQELQRRQQQLFFLLRTCQVAPSPHPVPPECGVHQRVDRGQREDDDGGQCGGGAGGPGEGSVEAEAGGHLGGAQEQQPEGEGGAGGRNATDLASYLQRLGAEEGVQEGGEGGRQL